MKRNKKQYLGLNKNQFMFLSIDSNYIFMFPIPLHSRYVSIYTFEVNSSLAIELLTPLE